MYRLIGQVKSISRSISQKPVLHITGSRIEGVGLHIMGSDIDVMLERPKTYTFTFNFADLQRRANTNTIFVDTSHTHLGYCNLVRMYFGCTKLIGSGRRADLDSSAHGPAQTQTMSGRCDVDRVECLSIPWPPCACEWVTRDRPSNFPPRDFICRSRNAHVVPTGYKGSWDPNAEWRFSFSLLELDLVYMWPTKTSKCYVLLKLMKKAIASQLPHLEETLCSYHLKTLLFWLTEEMGLTYWIDSQLEDCFKLSIGRLLSWVEGGDIPHYIIRGNNLFDMEASTPRRGEMATVLRNIMSEGLRFMSRSQLFQDWRLAMDELPNQTSHITTERVALHTDMAEAVDRECVALIQHCTLGDGKKCIDNDCRHGDVIQSSLVGHQSDMSPIVRYLTAVLRSTCATQIFSFQCDIVDNIARTSLIRRSKMLFEDTVLSNEFSLLKQANLHYHLGEYKSAIAILERVSDMSNDRILKKSYLDKVDREQDQTVANKKALSESRSVFTGVSISLVFGTMEINAMDVALKYELFKPDSQASTWDERSLSDVRSLAMVDPDVFMYYLLYLCYKQTDQNHTEEAFDNLCHETDHAHHSNAEEAFDNLCRVVRQDGVLHRPTALNILGHCYKKRGHLRQAVECFVESIQLRPNYNVAPMHLAILMAEVIQMSPDGVLSS